MKRRVQLYDIPRYGSLVFEGTDTGGEVEVTAVYHMGAPLSDAVAARLVDDLDQELELAFSRTRDFMTRREGESKRALQERRSAMVAERSRAYAERRSERQDLGYSIKTRYPGPDVIREIKQRGGVWDPASKMWWFSDYHDALAMQVLAEEGAAAQRAADNARGGPRRRNGATISPEFAKKIAAVDRAIGKFLADAPSLDYAASEKRYWALQRQKDKLYSLAEGDAALDAVNALHRRVVAAFDEAERLRRASGDARLRATTEAFRTERAGEDELTRYLRGQGYLRNGAGAVRRNGLREDFDLGEAFMLSAAAERAPRRNGAPAVFQIGDRVVLRHGNRHGTIVRVPAHTFDSYTVQLDTGATVEREASALRALTRRNGRLREDFDLGDALGLSAAAQRAPRRNGGHDVTIHAKDDRALSERDYPGVFADTDGDGTVDADDAFPRDPTRRGRNEEVMLSQEMRELIRIRNMLVGDKQSFENQLARAFPGRKVYGRVKTPVSMINKLRRKRLFNPKCGLTDVIGTTAIARDEHDLRAVQQHLRSGALGPVREEVDFYAEPLNGYRAVHFIVDFPTNQGNIPIEIQVKTDRQSKLAAAAHTPYKTGRLDGAALDHFGQIAVAADRGDAAARRQIDPLLSDLPALSRRLEL
jgi:ppGpp synthetase/RelA/SpoT-type nucleotidyltranferase